MKVKAINQWLGSDEEIRLFCSYLGNVLSKNSARGRGGGKEADLHIIKIVYDQVLPRFLPDAKPNGEDVGGRFGKITGTGKWQSGGFYPRDFDDED
jgi:hypothetical protein